MSARKKESNQMISIQSLLPFLSIISVQKSKGIDNEIGAKFNLAENKQKVKYLQ